MQVIDYRSPYRANPHERPHYVTIGHIGSGLIGLALLFVGGLAAFKLLPVGLSGVAVVAGLSHSAALAVVEVVLGLVFLSAATAPWPARGTLITMGLGTMVFGVVTTAEPAVLGGGSLAATGAVIALIGVGAVFLGWWDGPNRTFRRRR